MLLPISATGNDISPGIFNLITHIQCLQISGKKVDTDIYSLQFFFQNPKYRNTPQAEVNLILSR